MNRKFVMCGFIVMCAAFSACNSSSSDKNGTGGNGGVNQNGGSETFTGSYEAMDGCTTGRHSFSAKSDAEIAKEFCNALKDENVNNNCASVQRGGIFQTAQCEGNFNTISTGPSSSVFSQQYAYQENECGTGVHIFSASTQKDLNKMLCKALLDETLNNNCAKTKRMDDYKENNCDEVLKQ